MKNRILPYLPGIGIFLLALIISLAFYKDYGMGWDEPLQRDPGILNWNFAFHGDKTLFKTENDNHGEGFELLLLAFEKGLGQTDTREIFLTRHIITHVFFLLSVLAGYVLMFRLYRNQVVASLGMLMLLLAPRIYAHSYFNSKDIPFMSMMLVTLAICNIAFDKKRVGWYVLLGLACGYATAIRIMGVMPCFFIYLMLFADALQLLKRKEKLNKLLINAAAYTVTFCVIVYISWPYIWQSPVSKFIESFNALSHFPWNGPVLIGGEIIPAVDLPSSYFFTWFGISNPVLWLLLGLAGMVLVFYEFMMSGKKFFVNSPQRNQLLILLCFVAPIAAVIGMHSVIYDDWRHLYFIYPAFVLLGTHAIATLYTPKLKWAVVGAVGLQAALVGFFMVQNHPHQQVYFNSLVSHEDQFLRKNYELEYWGCSFKQGLDYLLKTDTARTIKVAGNYAYPLNNNLMMLEKKDRSRFQLEQDPVKADYFLTNFRTHPDEYPTNNFIFAVTVLNSDIMRVYKMKGPQPQAPVIPR